MRLLSRRPSGGFAPDARFEKRERAVAHVSGLVLGVVGVGIVVSAVVDAVTGGPHAVRLGLTGLGLALPGFAVWRFTRPPARLPIASIYAAVLTAWVVLSIAGAIPYIVTGTLSAWHDALFESIAGFTTTGATTLSGLDELPSGILFWRSMTQWFGGMGVIVLAVAVLPFLGVGGLSLMEAEAPGPSSERLVPRVRETARRLWLLYLGLTFVMIAAYLAAGMSPLDAVNHSFTTVSTGGFSTHDASLAHFGSAAVEWVAIVGMFLAAGSFALYWRMLRGRPAAFLRSMEAAAYVAIVLTFIAIAVGWRAVTEGWAHDLVRGSIFSVLTVISTTGYGTDDFAIWAPPLQLMLLFGMGLGGMTGSTAGGFKVYRLLAILAYARRQIVHQLHPRSVNVVRMGNEVVREDVVARTVGFFGLFMAAGAAATFVVAATGEDMVTSISAAASSIGNVGPGLGAVGPTQTFAVLDPVARVTLALLMLIGRLEIFPVLLGVVPVYRVIDDRVRRLRMGRIR